MGVSYKLKRPATQTKVILKYLALRKDSKLQRIILQKAPDGVYKSICNAFKNIAENPDIPLSKFQKNKYRKHKKLISCLISPQVKLPQKKRLIQKGGGLFLAALIPAAISTALSLFGTSFFNKE